MSLHQVFLLIASIGLLPIALSYGAVPTASLDFLFAITVSDLNSVHIYRAVMGLYLGLIVFWLMGAFKASLREAALYSLVVFMLGLAAGRVLSLVVDGFPHWLLFVYLVLEIAFGVMGLILLQRPEAKPSEPNQASR